MRYSINIVNSTSILFIFIARATTFIEPAFQSDFNNGRSTVPVLPASTRQYWAYTGMPLLAIQYLNHTGKPVMIY